MQYSEHLEWDYVHANLLRLVAGSIPNTTSYFGITRKRAADGGREALLLPKKHQESVPFLVLNSHAREDSTDKNTQMSANDDVIPVGKAAKEEVKEKKLTPISKEAVYCPSSLEKTVKKILLRVRFGSRAVGNSTLIGQTGRWPHRLVAQTTALKPNKCP